MADDPEKREIGGRFADPNPEWKRFHPLDDEGEQVVDENTLEKGWAEEAEPETPVARRWSLAWVGAVAIAITVATIAIAVKSGGGGDLPAAGPAYLTAAEREGAARDVLVDFLAAETAEQRITHILEPERLASSVEDYYSRPEVERIGLKRVDEIKLVELGGQPWIWIKFMDLEAGSHVASFKQTPAGMKLDWESFVAYGEMSWQRFCAERPSEPTQMRVYLGHSDYYNFKYSSFKQFAAFQIEARGSDQWLYGYTERGTDTYRAVGGSVVPGSRQPLNVRMHFEPDAGARNLVVIDELVHSLWLSPTIVGKGRESAPPSESD